MDSRLAVRLDGEQGSEEPPVPASIGRIFLFALLWMIPLGALSAFAAIDALRQGASTAFRYVGF